MRVSEMDGREFIRRSPEIAWRDPFKAYTSSAELKRRVKDTRQRQKHGTLGNTLLSEVSPIHPVITHELPPQLVEHYVMNLPDSALEFLDAFIGLYNELMSDSRFASAVDEKGMPMVHVYCFTREIEPDRARSDICQVRDLDMVRYWTRANYMFSE